MKDLKLRILVKDFTIMRKRGKWSDPEFIDGETEVLQYWDDKEGWLDIPKTYERVFIKKDK